MAVAAFKAVDAAGLARVDFFLERGTGRLYLNEINTMPGFTEISMYPKLWAASGVSFPELVTRIAELGLERFAERARATRPASSALEPQSAARAEGLAGRRRLGRLGYAGAGGGAGAAAAAARRGVSVRRHARRARGGAGGAPRASRSLASRPASCAATGTLRNFTDPPRVVAGIVEAYRLVRRFRPHVAFAAGGFAAVPPMVAARLAGAYTVIHQQDVEPGLANRLLVPFARRITVSLAVVAGAFPTRSARR